MIYLTLLTNIEDLKSHKCIFECMGLASCIMRLNLKGQHHVFVLFLKELIVYE